MSKLLAGLTWDPATLQNPATGSQLAVMAAMDTTNLRLSGWTVPASGIVAVRLHCTLRNESTIPVPQYLLGVLEGSTVRLRMSPMGSFRGQEAAGIPVTLTIFGLVTGLTPDATPDWDAAWGVETNVSSTGVRTGGPDNTTQGDATGAVNFEIYDPTS